jgi:hypothetical protein
MLMAKARLPVIAHRRRHVCARSDGEYSPLSRTSKGFRSYSVANCGRIKLAQKNTTRALRSPARLSLVWRVVHPAQPSQ